VKQREDTRPGMGISVVEWECPTWGCRGVLVADARPHFGQIVRCAPPKRVPKERTCGRLMRWNYMSARWMPALSTENALSPASTD
jgi:hypothetical protein